MATADFNELPRGAVQRVIDLALAEDLQSGDLTSECCVAVGVQAVARAIARHDMVVCGGGLFKAVFERVDPTTRVTLQRSDGDWVSENSVIWEVRGPARSVLSAERVALNFTQRLCGIATLSKRYADALTEGSRSRIADTRKTTPGLRLLERYAVRCGGAHNHRDNLGSAVMIKDNHIVAAGSIAVAVRRAQRRAPHTSRIEVEVTNLDEFEQARAAGADIIMLDNMDNATVQQALERIAEDRQQRRAPLIECSGGITLERIAELSALGVDVISVGALTHSAKAADISLEFAFDDGSPPSPSSRR